ncbi:DNA modification methylase [Microbacterium koreense]|uniref:DNA modification methylase n=1 Tax=Microbacterium koreense TaxID=323761 RepID=A0ABW2ZQF7_9MICO
MTSTTRSLGATTTTRRSRLFATVALGAAVALGATGCTFMTPQSTTIQYSAAEGVNVYDSGPLEVRNAFIVADEEGVLGNFVAAIVNDTAEAHTLRVSIGEGETVDLAIRVPANTVLSLGSDETSPVLIDGIEMLPGSDVPGFFESGDSEGALISVPVLDGGLDYLAPLVP